MAEQTRLTPAEVHEVLATHLLTDPAALVVDLERSRGSRIVDARTGQALPRPLHVLRLVAAGLQPPRAGRRPELRRRARPGRAAQAGQPGRLQHRVRRLRRHVRAGAGRPGPAAPVLRRGRRARRRERAQGRVRLEEPLERAARDRPRPGHEDHAPDPGVPRPQRLHDVADQHRAEQDRPVPEVRLAAHRRPGDPLPARRPPRRGRGRRGARARAGRAGVPGAPARHRGVHRRADPGRGRRQPRPPRVLRAR